MLNDFVGRRLLEHWQVSHSEAPRHSYESELATLHQMMQQNVSALLTDPQNIVKQTLIENGITKLCVFFGKQKGNQRFRALHYLAVTTYLP